MTALRAPVGDDAVSDVPVSPAEAQPAPPGPARAAPAAGQTRLTTVVVAGVGVLCALAVWFLIYAFALTPLEEHASQARLYDTYRLRLAAATAPLGGIIKSGTPVALISAPAGGIHNQVIVEGTTSGALESGPGHLSDTPLPGQGGASVIFGRSVTFGGPFGGITRLKAGDRIKVTTGQGAFTFEVYDVRYPGDLIKPLPVGKAGLTLVTSASSGWRSGWAPSHAVYVDALQVGGSAQPAPAGRPGTVGQASLPMQGDGKALVPLIFWVEGLLVAAAAFIWSWRRWGRRQTWIVGVPVLLALLWGASGAMMRFLPNLI